jgi:Transposase DDE domain group 1
MRWSRGARWWPRSTAGTTPRTPTDRAIGLTARFAACFLDDRAPAQVEHTVKAMVAQRVFGIALGYEDLIDHDQLRHDPVLATLAGKLQAKRQNCAPLAGKSTLNRLEHAPLGPSRYHKIGHDRQPSRTCSSRCSSKRTRRRRMRSSSTSTPRMIRCTATRKAASSTAMEPVLRRPKGRPGGRLLLSAAVRVLRPPSARRQSSGGQTSMRPPAPPMKSPASSARSVPGGRGSRSCCAPIRALPATS